MSEISNVNTEKMFTEIEIEKIVKYVVSIQLFIYEKRKARFLKLLENERIGDNWGRMSYRTNEESGVTFVSRFGNISVNDKLVIKPFLFEGSEEKLMTALDELEDFFNRALKMVGGTMFFIEGKPHSTSQPDTEVGDKLRIAV